MPSDFESYVVARLDELETRHRRQRRLGMWLGMIAAGQGLLLLYLLLPVSGWLGVPKLIEASRFVLVDDRGRVRAELVDDQGPRLSLLTADGQERAILWVNHDGAARVLLTDNRNGAGRIACLYAFDEGAGVELLDQKGARATLMLSEQQSGLHLFDEKGRPAPGVQKP